jgi:hypothetical protein
MQNRLKNKCRTIRISREYYCRLVTFIYLWDKKLSSKCKLSMMKEEHYWRMKISNVLLEK